MLLAMYSNQYSLKEQFISVCLRHEFSKKPLLDIFLTVSRRESPIDNKGSVYMSGNVLETGHIRFYTFLYWNRSMYVQQN